MTPFFSVIVPTRDRPDRLVRCLRALAQLDYPGDAFEVVVVDDGSGSRSSRSSRPCRPSFR